MFSRIAMMSVAVFGVGIAVAAPPPSVQQRIDTWIADKPGGIALAWADEDGAAVFCAGHFSKNDGRRITADTQFALGSVTKVFTALLLAESDRLAKASLRDEVSKFLILDDSQSSSMTLLALASHRAGLPTSPNNFVEHRGAPDDPYAMYDRSALIEAFRAHRPGSPVGRATVYSNFGVAVLGEALAVAWETTYAEALRRHVLQPLGMNLAVIATANEAKSSALPPDHVALRTVPKWTFKAFAPAGGLLSSGADMSRFLAACVGHAAKFPSRSIEATFQVQTTAEDFDAEMGLCWLVDRRGDYIAWHPGATAGSRAIVVVNRTRRQAIAVMANSGSAVSPLAFEVLGVNRSHDAMRSPATIVGADEVRGTYLDAAGNQIAITARNGVIYAKKQEWDDALPLREIRRDHYAVMLMPAEIGFERDDAGRVIAMLTDLDGTPRRAIRQQ